MDILFKDQFPWKPRFTPMATTEEPKGVMMNEHPYLQCSVCEQSCTGATILYIYTWW